MPQKSTIGEPRPMDGVGDGVAGLFQEGGRVHSIELERKRGSEGLDEMR